MPKYEGDERREKLSLPNWLIPFLAIIISGVGGTFWNSWNEFQALKKDMEYIRRDVSRNTERLDKLEEGSVKFQDKVLSGVNELVARKEKK